MGSRCLDLVRHLRIDRFEVLQIPGVDDFSSYLYRATQKKRVVNASAGESAFRSLLDGCIVFSLIESDDIETVAHFLKKRRA